MTLSNAAYCETAPRRLRSWDPGWGVLIALLVALTLIRIAALFVSPSDLGFDEAQYWAWSRDFAFGYFTKPPMIAWVIGLESKLCGSTAACVRIASPLIHLANALVLALLARRLYGRAAGIWAGVLYAIMPGIAVSSFLMTTDVLLLFFWSVALYGLVVYVERPSLMPALVFGVATGLGLYAKYAMIYLPAMAVIAAFALPDVRRALMRGEAALALLVMLLVIAPNLWWNAANGFATFEHTGDNIGWSLSRLNAVSGFAFLSAQIGVAGPAIILAMGSALLLGMRSDRPEADRLLLWLSWPLLFAITVQGFLSQANANWGAAAYPAGLVLAAGLIVHRRWRILLVGNLILCGVVALGVIAATATVDPKHARWPFEQLRQLGGWTETGDAIARLARARGSSHIVVDGRPLAAGLAWALRDEPVKMLAFLPRSRPPGDQFELDAPWTPGDPTARTLLVGVGDAAAARLGAREIATIEAPIYSARDGTLTVYAFD